MLSVMTLICGRQEKEGKNASFIKSRSLGERLGKGIRTSFRNYMLGEKQRSGTSLQIWPLKLFKMWKGQKVVRCQPLVSHW